jgi:8-oxo-dGTP diphosphatase
MIMSDDAKTQICKRPHVGIGVLIKKDGKVLFGHRKGAHGSGEWAPPGGKLDFGEDFFTCAKREVEEETGITIKNLKLGPYTNDYFESDSLHYVTLFVIADYDSGTVEIKEPNKCVEWRWVEWNNIPEPLFLTIRNLKKQNYDLS